MRHLALLALSLLAVCAMAAESIVIPVCSPFSGQLASFGEGVKNAALLYEKQWNAKESRKIEIRLEDDVAEPKNAKVIATKLVANPRVTVVVGHLTSSACLAASPTYRDGTLSAISPSATNPSLAAGSPFYFRNVYKDDFQGSFLARYAAEVRGFKKIAIFYETNDYSTGLKDAFVAEAGKAGLEIVGAEAYTSETTDFTPQLAKFRVLRPDALFVPGYAPQGTLIASQAKKSGLQVPMFGADGLDDDAMAQNPDAEGLFVTTPFLPSAAGDSAKAFIAAYTEAYGVEPNWFAANTYDAVALAVQAAIAGNGDRQAVRDHLAAIDSAEEAFQGVTGATWFDANGDCQKPAFVKQLKGGAWTAAKQLQ